MNKIKQSVDIDNSRLAIELELNIPAAIDKLNNMDSGLWSRGGYTHRELIAAIVQAALSSE